MPCIKESNSTLELDEEDPGVQALLTGAFRNSPEAKRRRGYVPERKPRIETDLDVELLLTLRPHLDRVQAVAMVASMRALYTGDVSIDEEIRSIFFEIWKGDAYEDKVMRKQRWQKTDGCNLRNSNKVPLMVLLRLVCRLLKELQTPMTQPQIEVYHYGI